MVRAERDYASPMTDYDQRSLLNELEPEAGRLYDRHASVAQEWFPHDFIPYRLGRDFDKEPWTPDQPRLTGVAQTAFEIGLLTEDNLPSYHRLIHGMFGAGDGAWINWVGRWTAEEGRHAIVLRDYLTVTRNIDPIMLERGRMTQLQQGYDHESPDTLRGLAYVTFQELATRIAHRNTGRYSNDPVADKIMVRIAADENLHMVFYRDIISAALVLEPSAAVCAIVDEVLAFQMPGAGIPGFIRKAAQIAKAGIYDIRVHRDEVLMPILRHWRIFELTNLDAAAEAARTRLAEHLAKLDEAGQAVRGARLAPTSSERCRADAETGGSSIASVRADESPHRASVPFHDRFWQVSLVRSWVPRSNWSRAPRRTCDVPGTVGHDPAGTTTSRHRRARQTALGRRYRSAIARAVAATRARTSGGPRTSTQRPAASRCRWASSGQSRRSRSRSQPSGSGSSSVSAHGDRAVADGVPQVVERSGRTRTSTAMRGTSRS